MRTKISLCDYIDNINVPNRNTPDNSVKREKYKTFIKNAMKTNLTENQQNLMELYYIKGLSMPQIAENIGINKSTVSRTIKCAREKIRELYTICFF